MEQSRTYILDLFKCDDFYNYKELIKNIFHIFIQFSENFEKFDKNKQHIILAPGDSPNKLILLLEHFKKIPKNITIIKFMLSGMNEDSDIEEYLKFVLNKNNILEKIKKNLNDYVFHYMDYIQWGNTYNAIDRALQKLFPNKTDYNLNKLQIFINLNFLKDNQICKKI